jgi:hypothetical protein
MPNNNQSFDNCYLLQYSIVDGRMVIHEKGIRSISKVVPTNGNEPFYGVDRGTKYGIRKLIGTTHWAIVDATDLSNMKIIHTDAYPEISSPQLIKARGHYIIVRSSPTNIKLYISRHKSFQEMRRNMKRRSAGS